MDFQNLSYVSDFPALDELNSQEIMRLMPLVVYLMLVAIVGILGNGLVCHVYRTKYKLSNSQCFILVLSFIDLFSCLFVVPFEIIVVLHQYNFQHGWVCKVSRFFNTLPTVASGFVLLSIAMDRYRKVCRPLGRQISFSMAKLMCLGSVIAGILFAWPALALYGRKTFLVSQYNLNATECSTDDSLKGSVFPFINNLTFGLLFLFGTTSLTVLYTLIGRQISRIAKHDQVRKESAVGLKQNCDNQGRHHHNTSNSYSLRDESSSSDDKIVRKAKVTPETVSGASGPSMSPRKSDQVGGFETDNGSADKVPPLRSISFENTNIAETYSLNSNASYDSNKKRCKRGILKKMSTGSGHHSTGSSTTAHSGTMEAHPIGGFSHQRQTRARQMSLLMFLISLAYFLSYLPHVLLMLLRAVKSGFVDAMSDEGRAAYKFFLRSYAFNCVINPFIYGACDARFRKACKIVFNNMCHSGRRPNRPSRRQR